MEEPYFTPPQIAKRLKVSADKVRAWILSGELKAMNLGNRTRPRFRIRPDWLAAFEASRSVEKKAVVATRRLKVAHDYFASAK